MPIRLALLGVWHVHAIHHLEWSRDDPEAEIAVVWDSDAAAGAAFAEKHGLPFEPDLQAVLSRPDISGVVVDTPTTQHRSVIEAAIGQGKHVFTEKVLAVSAEDARALVTAAERAGVILRVSLQRLGEAPVQTVKRLLAEGAVGTITASRIRYSHHGAVGTPWIPAHFFNREQAGGGVLVDLGAHPIYLSLMIHDAVPNSVRCVLGSVVGLGVEDNAVAVLRYPGGVLSVLEASFVAGFFSYAMEVTGTAGTIVLGPVDQRVMLRRSGSDQWVEQVLSEPLANTLSQFVAAVQVGQADPEHLSTSLSLTQIVEASYASADSGREIALDLGTIR